MRACASARNRPLSPHCTLLPVAAKHTTQNIATYNFLFIYILVLINDLEDPFEYSLLSLIPLGQSEDAHGSTHQINPYSKGAADVDMYPILECYSRLYSHSVEGLEGGAGGGAIAGVRGSCAATVSRRPSELIRDEDAMHSTKEELDTRHCYRLALRKQLQLTLRQAEKEHAEKVRAEGRGGGSGSAGGAKPRKAVGSGSVNGGEEPLLAGP